MTGQRVHLQDLKLHPTQGLVQENLTIPLLWSQLTPESRRQLAQQLAQMIQKIREMSGQEKGRDERV
ncbi:MAG TPA: hypothetical protein VMT46_19430 [Anaerolineaceae bacterium]|nr:hypothetical protein [Anaerolineaceae bacterium]